MALKEWNKLLLPFWVTFLLLQFATRAFLTIYSGADGDDTAWELMAAFLSGFVFDIAAMGFALIPVVLLHLAMPSNAMQQATRGYRVSRSVAYLLFVYILLFTAASEYFFWEEFGTRFNFIAVDYLVYTQEVIGNIKESYPLTPILFGLLTLSLLATLFWHKRLCLPAAPTTRAFRLSALGIILLPFALTASLPDTLYDGKNQSLDELAKNGTYALFSAYQHNELDFKSFYLVASEQAVSGNMRKLLAEEENDFVNNDPQDITRIIQRKGPELHKNVVMVTMESLSADFMQSFGNDKNLTPNLDQLAKEGLFFTKMYATGTRTVRGLEALSLSIPPTPGQSILRRKGNGDLFTVGNVFQDRGYDTAFIYGGHGYFDNMNAFFDANHYRIVDRNAFADNEVQFANVWGVCDEDLYKQVIKQADAAIAKDKPFFYMVMTTSNHRPYTFPAGKIDLPAEGGGRSAGVKYADFAVGEFIRQAKTKPWFKDTVFIFVADHTAGAGGKTELSLEKYHIPAIIYSPGFIKPQTYDLTSSQIDVPPVVFGLLNFSYYTKFFGEDLLNDADEAAHAHAFISNYQKIGLLMNDELSVLEPKRITKQYRNDEEIAENREDPRLILDTVSYYQYAAGWRERMKRIPTVVKE